MENFNYVIYKKEKLAGKKMSWELIVVTESRKFRDFFFPVKICFLTFHDIQLLRILASWGKILFSFAFPITCENNPFLHFSFPWFTYIFSICHSYGNKFQDVCSNKCIFREFFLAVSNSQGQFVQLTIGIFLPVPKHFDLLHY